MSMKSPRENAAESIFPRENRDHAEERILYVFLRDLSYVESIDAGHLRYIFIWGQAC
jgi:hypothetical protein